MDAFQTYLRELRPSDLDGSAGLYRLKEELTRRVNVSIAPARAIGVYELLCELEIDGKRDETLLRPVVEVALDPATLCVGCCNKARSGCAKLVDLEP